MFKKLMALATLAVLAATAAADHVNFHEIFINPPGGSDETQGIEYIILKGTPSMSLDDYSVVVVENEHSGSGADDRGCVDNIFPLKGLSLDSHGYLIIRDYKGKNTSQSNTTLGVLNDLVSIGSNLNVEFSKTNSTATLPWSFPSNVYTPGGSNTLTYGGNSLENSGGNYFLVKHVNPTLFQQIDTPRSIGISLDKDLNGVLDYLQTSKPTGWVQPWESIEDAVSVLVENANAGAATQIDYVASLTSGQYNTRCIQTRPTSSNGFANFTGDWFARLYLTSGSDTVPTDKGIYTDLLTGGVADRYYFDGTSGQNAYEDGTATTLSSSDWIRPGYWVTSGSSFVTNYITISRSGTTYYH